MSSSEVVSRVGAPGERRRLNQAEWWLYSDPEHHIVVIDADTVANCLTRQEAMRIMDTVLRSFDSPRKK